MAYERLDIEVTDNGSSRTVKRDLEQLGTTAAQVGGTVNGRLRQTMTNTQRTVTGAFSAMAGSARTFGGQFSSMVGGLMTRLGGFRGSVANTVSSLRGLFGGGGWGGGGRGGGAPGAAASAAGASMRYFGNESMQAAHALNSLNALMYALPFIFAIGKTIQWADAYQNIRNKIDLVTESSSELAAVNEAVYASAQKTRTGYMEMAELFQTISLQAGNLGLSQAQVMQLSETITMASQIANTSQVGATAGVKQLIQALALGRLSGQNFNSVMEQTPRIAIAIADAMGTTTDRLRQLALDKKITSAALAEALLGQSEEIAKEFLRIKPTISQAFTVLDNGMIAFIGRLEEATGFASTFAEWTITLADNIDIVAASAAVLGIVLLAAFSGSLVRAITLVNASLMANPFGLMVGLVAALVAAFYLLQGRMQENAALFAVFAGAATAIALAIMGPFVSALIAGTSAVYAFTAAILTNPLMWLVGIIAVAVGALVYFGIKNHEVNGKVVSGWSYLKAVAAGSFSAIVAGVQALWQNIQRYFSAMGRSVMGLGMAFSAFIDGDWGNAATLAGNALKDAAGSMNVFEGVGAAMGSAYSKGFNASIADAAAVVPGGKKSGLDTTPGIPNPAVDPDEGKDKDKGSKPDRRLSRAEMIAEEMRRISEEAATAGNLAYTYLDRAAFEALDKFSSSLRSKKDKAGNPFAPMDEQERSTMLDALLGLEKAKRLQQARDEIMRQAIGPRVQYLETEEAIVQLLNTRQITAQEAERASIDAQIAFYQTQEDKLSGQALGRLNILKEIRDEATPVARAMKSIWDDANGPARDYAAGLEAVKALEEQHLLTIEQKARALRDLRIAYLESQPDAASGLEAGRLRVQRDNEDVGPRLSRAYESEWAKANAELRDLYDRQEALQQLMQDDPINSGRYAQQLGIIRAEMKAMQPGATVFDQMRAGLARFASDFTGILPGINAAWGNWLQQIGDGFADTIGRAIVYGDNLHDSLAKIGQSAMASLISALVKLGVQWLIMQVIGQGSQQAIMATGIAAGAATAAAWAPAAAMVSLATFGANAAPAMAGIASTNALSMAFALPKGFKAGGWTGAGGVDEVAGVVHGQEFVMNAQATRQWLPLLERLNAGLSPSMGFAQGGYAGRALSGTAVQAVAAASAPGAMMVGGDSINLSIDARGAEAGVEDKIRDALDEALPVFLNRARKQEEQVDKVRSNRQRIGSAR